MYLRIIRHDMAQSKLITLTTAVFVAAAAMLVSLSAILAVHLLDAMDHLMKQAKTPHFVQMHSGDIDRARLAHFAEQNRLVDEFQVMELLVVDNTNISIGGRTLADSVQDNSFTTQSDKFDYLLDLDGNVIHVKDGEIYVPVGYMKDGTAKVGDIVQVGGRTLVVAGFLRDSQMNSWLASSKRFLVSEHDYAALKDAGRTEYLIEFRLKDASDIGAFEADYISRGLEANGPTITYPLFRMLNAISDGLMIAVLLLASGLVCAIAFLCIRFTLLAKIEDDYREIGVLKAIGMRVSDIKKMYLAKYAVIAATGCMAGWALSHVFKGMLLENIRLYLGGSEHSAAAFFFPIAGVVLVFLAILGYANTVLRRFRKISAAEAIRFGASREQGAVVTRWNLAKNRLIDTNLFLGVKDVLARKKLYATMLAVMVISAFLILVPLNLSSTISSKDFITYMGIGNSDIRIDLQQADQLSEKAAEVLETIRNDQEVAEYALLATKSFKVRTEDGSEKRIKIELGDHSVFPVKYSEGRAPIADNEIALSVLNAEELGKKVGDVITLEIEGKAKHLTVSGVYSDITNGGKTAKAVFSDLSAEIMWYVLFAQLADPTLVLTKVSEYTKRFPYAKISDIREYIKHTYGSTIRSVQQASLTAAAVALVITALVTLLFMNMVVAKDRYEIAVLKALGFTNSDITVQYAARAVVVSVAGIILGTVLANTAGERLAGAVISSFGASSFEFVVQPLAAYLFVPLMLVCTVLAATILATSGAGQMTIAKYLKE